MERLNALGLLQQSVTPSLRGDAFWERYWVDVCNESPAARSVHLGVFVQPYLEYALAGRKTIESRFSAVRQPPYGSVLPGDVLLLKASAGPIVGICRIIRVWTYRLDANSWSQIRHSFALPMCAEDPEFWLERKHASFATLMQIADARTLEPIGFEKSDRRGWVVLRRASQQLEFGDAT